jgi:hypothetical protein
LITKNGNTGIKRNVTSSCQALTFTPVWCKAGCEALRRSAAEVPPAEFREFAEGLDARGAVQSHYVATAAPRNQVPLGVRRRFDDLPVRSLRASPRDE